MRMRMMSGGCACVPTSRVSSIAVAAITYAATRHRKPETREGVPDSPNVLTYPSSERSRSRFTVLASRKSAESRVQRPDGRRRRARTVDRTRARSKRYVWQLRRDGTSYSLHRLNPQASHRPETDDRLVCSTRRTRPRGMSALASPYASQSYPCLMSIADESERARAGGATSSKLTLRAIHKLSLEILRARPGFTHTSTRVSVSVSDFILDDYTLNPCLQPVPSPHHTT